MTAQVLMCRGRAAVVAALTGLLTLASTSSAAPADDMKPSVVSNSLRPLALVETVPMPALDLKAVRTEDEARALIGLPPRYAIPHPVFLTPQTAGTWERLPDGTAVWRLRITARNAHSINLGFTRYRMPAGARLFIYAADLEFVIRPFTDADNEDHGELWTPPVPSHDVVIELTVPGAADLPGALGVDLELGSINLGYRGFGDMLVLSGACNVDVICPEGDDWWDEIPAIGVISTGGSTFCTGFMVNNVRQDLVPFFMTANHCGIGPSNAPSLVVFWNYENSWCRPPGSSESGGPGDGALDQFNTGSFFRAAYSGSDFTLVELDDDPDPAWFVSYAGWDATGADAAMAIAIHHPNTDEKRISFEYEPTTTTSYLADSVPGDGTHVRVEDWDLGTTEPGSSGSPLFNQDHHIIGQLHGGYAACGNDDPDWYGKLSVSWTHGLSDWLDPDATGTLIVGTISTAGLTVAPTGDVHHLGEVGGPFTNETVPYTLTNSTAGPIDYRVSLSNAIGLLVDGGVDPITGSLAPGEEAVVTVTVGPPIYGLPAGVYKELVVFEDLALGLVRERRHVVEIGQTGFATAPAGDFSSSGPTGGPFTETTLYSVTSTHPSPVEITVEASASWVSLDGATDPLTVSLHGIGDSADVTIGFSPDAELLPAGVHQATVAFTNDAGGAGDTSRLVLLDVGRLVYFPEDTPLPIRDNETTTSTIEIAGGFCVGDVDVTMDISHTYVGDLIVELQSPSGTTVRLHDRSGSSSNDIVTTYDDDGEGTPPDGPGRLSDFDYASSAGTWTLTVADRAGSDVGTLNDWALRIAPIGDDCPEPVLVYQVSMDSDPGWSTDDAWAHGQPTGSGGEYGSPDPEEGHTGANVYGYNLNGDYESDMPERHLTSTAFDCTGLTGVRLKFHRWLGVEQSAYDHAAVRVSNDNVTWTTVWQNTSEVADASWTLQSYDLAAVADGRGTVYVRWTMGVTDGSWQYCGWNVDDVEIWAFPLEDCPEDLDGSGAVDFPDVLAILAAWGPCSGCPEDLDGSGAADFGDLLLLLQSWGPCP